MERITTIIGGILLFVGIVCLISVLLAWPTMLLWNWLMPVIFKLPVITFWQALGLTCLSNILFKSTTTTEKK